MKNVIIGTAGHIDHGKTTLIKALTGRNTDTLREEIKRGISINLGFTYFDLPSGKRAGIVDVPGHEKFIKNMLAGASGIDIVLLTVAANEGVKPQTIEHLDILSYLNIKSGLIVLTKVDLADEILIELAIDDIKEKVKGTFFENSEILQVDSISGNGLDTLINKIDKLSEEIEQKNINTSSRLNIDRIFSMKGFGTIVTGTLVEGKINIDDELVIYPKNLKTKIRNIQVHEQNVKTAYAGQRTAINISNIKPFEIERGDILAKADSMKETNLLDVKISLVNHTERELKFWERIRVYIGSKEILARLVPLDVDTIKCGESAFCQLRLEEYAVAKKNDKFVIRYYSPLETIGGGIILDPNPVKHKKCDKLIIENLKVKEKGEISEIIEEFIQSNNEKYTSIKDISNYVSLPEQEVSEILQKIISQGIIITLGNNYFHMNTIENFKMKVIEILSNYHEKFNLKQGMFKEELRSKLSLSFKTKEFEAILRIMEQDNLIKITNSNLVSIFSFNIIYNKSQQKIKNEIENILLKSNLTPPSISELTNNNSKEFKEVLDSILGNTVVKLDEQTVIHKNIYEKAKNDVINFINKNGELTLAQFRDITGSSRKYSMLILEDFDKNKITMRLENKRILFQ